MKADPEPSSGERLFYRVTYKGAPVITDSSLGLDFVDSGPLDRDFEVMETARDSQDETWENPFGTKRIIPDRYNQLTISLQERRKPRRRVDLILRAYDEGVAFQYFLPQQEPKGKKHVSNTLPNMLSMIIYYLPMPIANPPHPGYSNGPLLVPLAWMPQVALL